MGRMFDQFKRVMTFAVTDAELAKRNALLADPAFKADLVERIAALAPDTVLYFDFQDVASVDGGFVLDPESKLVRYEVGLAQPTSAITFAAKALAVPMRIVGVSIAGALPSSDDGSGPNTRVELNVDASQPEAIVNTSLAPEVRLALNGQPAVPGWSLGALAILLIQE